MTEKKKVSMALLSILENPMVLDIINREKDVMDLIPEVLNFWKYDLMNRKPSPAYNDGNTFQSTDLDLATFLYSLSGRSAIINLPVYKSRTAKTINEEQMIVSSKNRHGKLVGVMSNKETFAFSVRVIDMNVMTTDKVGFPRNFNITDPSGEFYDGWHEIQFLPNNDENKFLQETQILTENKIIFKNFVHPNRWISFYGQYYFITKILEKRLTEECQNIFEQIKEMKKKIPLTSSDKDFTPSPKKDTSDLVSNKVQCFECDIDIDFSGDFKKYDITKEIMLDLIDKRNYYLYTALPLLRFNTRLTEFAFYKYGEGKFPSWLKNVKWEEGYREKGKRTDWERLVLFQPKPFQPGIAIRKRTFERTIQERE